MAGAMEGDTFIGRKAQELRGLLKIRYPMTHGVVTDWNDMERIWSHVYTEELRTLSEEVRRRRPDPELRHFSIQSCSPRRRSTRRSTARSASLLLGRTDAAG